MFEESILPYAESAAAGLAALKVLPCARHIVFQMQLESLDLIFRPSNQHVVQNATAAHAAVACDALPALAQEQRPGDSFQSLILCSRSLELCY